MRRIFIALILVLIVGAAIWVSNGGSTKEYSVGSLRLPKIFESEAKVLFVGDMMFDRYIRQWSEKKGGDYLFSCEDKNGQSLSSFLKSYDLVVGNLEGPITDNPSRSMGTEVGSDDNFVFTFPPETAKLLAKNNIKLVSLANNHMLNFSLDGLLETKRYLEKAGVGYFGSPDEARGSASGPVFRTEIAGVPVSLVSWSDWNSDNTDITAADIKKEADAGNKVIVYAHWGEEYVPPPARVKRLARSFIDAGADMVIGSHPHVIQESEIYRSKPIYYSLGNFIFDQYWNEEVRTGLALEVDVQGTDSSKWRIIEHKVHLEKDGRTCVIE